jgi:hypothetical protein
MFVFIGINLDYSYIYILTLYIKSIIYTHIKYIKLNKINYGRKKENSLCGYGWSIS